MHFTNISLTKSKASFEINDIDVSVVNAIRRTILSEIPNVAFDFDLNAKNNDIIVNKNTCSLHNEFLCHRIALVPLHFNEHEIEHFESSKYRFVLRKKNDTNDMMDVTTEDFDILDETGKTYGREFVKRILPPNEISKDYILLTVLKPNIYDNTKGDEIDIEARPSINIAQVNSRWSPVSLCSFYNTIDENTAEIELNKYLKEQEHSGIDVKELTERFDTLLKYRCFKKNNFGEPCSFQFAIESECLLSPQYLVQKSIHILVAHINSLIKDLETKENMKLEQYQGMSILKLDNCEHTIANLLQANIYNIMIRNKDEKYPIEYLGYFKPHPLEPGIVMKIKCQENVIETLKYGFGKIVNYLNDLSNEWSVSCNTIKH